MIINNKALAPHFGVWNVTEGNLPGMGHVVLGLGWQKSGVPVVQFVEWRVIEEGDEPSDIDPDKLFEVCDGIEHASACWFASFGNGDDDPIAIHAPPLWADCQFTVSLPIRIEPDNETEGDE